MFHVSMHILLVIANNLSDTDYSVDKKNDDSKEENRLENEECKIELKNALGLS